MNTPKLNRLITFEVWENSQNEFGDASQTIAETFNCRAHFDNNAINQNTYEGQQQWGDKGVFKLRYGREIKSVYTIIYEGWRWTIDGVNVENEGHKRWYSINVSKLQIWQA